MHQVELYRRTKSLTLRHDYGKSCYPVAFHQSFADEGVPQENQMQRHCRRTLVRMVPCKVWCAAGLYRLSNPLCGHKRLDNVENNSWQTQRHPIDPLLTAWRTWLCQWPCCILHKIQTSPRKDRQTEQICHAGGPEHQYIQRAANDRAKWKHITDALCPTQEEEV